MYLSVDIGGTKTLLALFTSNGHCLKRLKFMTNRDPISYVKALHTNLQHFIPNQFIRNRILAVTVAIPGVVTAEPNNYSFKFGNLDWPNIDLITPIKNLFNCKISFVNDANLATLYEANRPSCIVGKSIYLTFSTGIGGGIAKDGKLLLKASDAFEPGHIKYIYNNRSTEWEDVASAKALTSTYKCQTLQDLCLNETIIDDLVIRLSLGLLDIIKNESPDTIIIGGPICFLYDNFKQTLENYLRTKLKTESLPKLKKAHRPTESVIYGAYLYSKQNHQK